MAERTIGIVLRPGVSAAVDLAKRLIDWAGQRKIAVKLEEDSAVCLEFSGESCTNAELARSCDPIITLGGDGTLIGVGRESSRDGPTLVGVNFGTLGFLTEIHPDDLFEVLEQVLSGKANVAERFMLHAAVMREGQQCFASNAVNDAVILKGSRDKLLNLDVFVDGQEIMRVRADGLIAGTPTGSTAYSLAAGGSIVYPSLPVLLLTPICPHALTARPLVLPLDIGVSVRIPDYTGEVFLSIDGQESAELEPGDHIELTRSGEKVHFVRSAKESYFDILRQKLNWGISNPEKENQ